VKIIDYEIRNRFLTLANSYFRNVSTGIMHVISRRLAFVGLLLLRYLKRTKARGTDSTL
jgi:hypothetical protein